MTARTNYQAPWVLHIAVPTLTALVLSIGFGILVHVSLCVHALLTVPAYTLFKSSPADWKSCICLLLCCILTPLVLIRWTVVWLWNTVTRNKYKTLTAVTIGGMDYTDIQWLLASMFPILIIIAKGIIIISLSIFTITITISSVRLGLTYMRKYRSTAFLITLLVCLAACSGGHTGQLNQRPPRPLPLPLLHICSQPKYQSQPTTQPSTQHQAPLLSHRRST